MKLESLQDLFHHELKDFYSAENQLVKALPKMAKAAANEQLKAGFEEHVEQTKGHVERLEIAGYGTARALAAKLGHDEAVSLLEATLEEEKATDQKLTELAESAVNAEAGAAGKSETD